MEMKIGRHTYTITEEDRFLDNKSCILLLTQSKENVNYMELKRRNNMNTDEFIPLPSELTAENGAKALLIGEFTIESQEPCDECAHEYGCDGAPECDCEDGYVTVQHTVDWTTIKEIYAKVVEHYTNY